MLEMLAVLAIVGVLSIAALVGFMYAMNKIRANDTMRDVNLWALRATETEQTYQTGQTIPTDDIGYKSTHGYDIAAVAAGNNLFAVELFGLSDKVCRLLLEMAASSYVVEATHDGMGNGVQFDGNDTSVCANEPTLYFYFDSNMNKPTDVCLPACGVEETCCNNGCYPTDGLCGSLCACPTGTECKGDGLCCLPESEPCNGTCCPASQICTNGSCSCPQGATINEEGQCVCPSGSMLVDNKCQSVICTGSGSNYTCTDINGNRCGTGCNEDGSVCVKGYCQNYCPAGTSYQNLPHVSYFGCVRGDLNCFPSGNEFHCYIQEEKCGQCSSVTGEKCTGMCIDICENGSTFGHNAELDMFGCLHNETAVFCTRGSSTTIQCYKDGMYCGRNCSTLGTDCQKGSCNDENICSAGWTLTIKNNSIACLNDTTGHYCQLKNEACFDENDHQCGYACTFDAACTYGSCQDLCPTGLSYQSVSNGYGCYNPQTQIACENHNTLITRFNCYKNKIQCGHNCTDYLASGCPDCLDEIICPAGTYFENNMCISSDGVKCQLNGTCSIQDNINCGQKCDLDGNNCKVGLCRDTCPSGTQFGKNGMTYYGCIGTQSPIIACYPSSGNYLCYKDWTQCGTTCTNYTGAGCPDCQT